MKYMISNCKIATIKTLMHFESIFRIVSTLKHKKYSLLFILLFICIQTPASAQPASDSFITEIPTYRPLILRSLIATDARLEHVWHTTIHAPTGSITGALKLEPTRVDYPRNHQWPYQAKLIMYLFHHREDGLAPYGHRSYDFPGYFNQEHIHIVSIHNLPTGFYSVWFYISSEQPADSIHDYLYINIGSYIQGS